MIGKLRGVVDAVGETHAIIDVNGVGYEVQLSSRALGNLTPGDEVALTIDTHVRDDAIRLFGFQSEIERRWFRTLQTIQGVGAKVALGVLGILPPSDLGNAIQLDNWAAVSETPGVGKKLAQRIVAELKDKALDIGVGGVSVGGDGGSGAAQVGNDAQAEALSALSNLGYNPAQAATAIARAIEQLGPDADTSALIRQGLKELSG